MTQMADDRKEVSEEQVAFSGQSSTIRGQLLLASLFPLAFFSLLSILVMAVALYQVTLRLALQSNMAEARSAADELAKIATAIGLKKIRHLGYKSKTLFIEEKIQWLLNPT